MSTPPKVAEYTEHVCTVHLVFFSYWQLLRHNEQGLPRGAAGSCPPALLGRLHPAAGDGGPGGGVGVRGRALGHEVPRKKLILYNSVRNYNSAVVIFVSHEVTQIHIHM